MNKRHIYVLLTRFPDRNAKLIGFLTNSYYTHASLGLEEDMNTFYSFIHKGFIVENLSRYLRPEWEPLPCQLYQLEVSETVYETVKRMVQIRAQQKKYLRYSRIGVVMCLMGIPFKRKNHYFCSQFVAETLHRSEALKLKKCCSLYFPGDFHKLPEVKLHYQGNLLSMLRHFSVLPC